MPRKRRRQTTATDPELGVMLVSQHRPRSGNPSRSSCSVASEPQARGILGTDEPILPAQCGPAGAVLDGHRVRLVQPIMGRQAPEIRVPGEDDALVSSPPSSFPARNRLFLAYPQSARVENSPFDAHSTHLPPLLLTPGSRPRPQPRRRSHTPRARATEIPRGTIPLLSTWSGPRESLPP